MFKAYKRVLLVVGLAFLLGTAAVFTVDVRSQNDVETSCMPSEAGKYCTFFHPGNTGHMQTFFSEDGTKLITSGANTIRYWDMSTGLEVERVVDTGFMSYNAIEFDGKLLAAVNTSRLSTVAVSDKVRLWNLSDNEIFQTLEGHVAEINLVGISPDRKFITSGDRNHFIVWDAETFEEVHKMRNGQLYTLAFAFTSDSRIMITGTGGSHIKMWDLETGELIRQIDTLGSAVVLSPDDSYIVTAGIHNEDFESSTVVNMWSTEDGSFIRSLEHEHGIRHIGFSPDGRTLATTSQENITYFWNVADWTLRETIPVGDEYLTYSPDGRYIILSGPSPDVKVWRLR